MTEEVKNEQPQIKTVNFEGKQYNTEDLTPRVVEGFNMLIKLQGEVVEQSYQLKKSQAAQEKMSQDIGVMIAEDKIKDLNQRLKSLWRTSESITKKYCRGSSSYIRDCTRWSYGRYGGKNNCKCFRVR